MQIVIDIDENLYTRLFDNGVDNYDDAVDMARAIRKGIPLPKGHGWLIDADELTKEIKGYINDTSNLHYDDLEEAEAYNSAYYNCLDEIENSLAIVEAEIEE